MKNILIVITGPTAVGKTAVALKLAQHLPAEIINADIGQCYTPLTIGTAKPDWRREKVPHHLFDIIDEPKNITVVDFKDRLFTIVHDLFKRNKLPIVVGGSSFYVKSLFFPPILVGQLPGNDQERGRENLWQRLQAIDPMRAERIHPHDTYRLERALAIWQSAGKLPSSLVPQYDPPGSFYCGILLRNREQLYQKINERVIQMFDQGWVEEVSALMGTDWEPFLKKKKIIGYDIIIEYLQAGMAVKKRDEMITRIQTKTRQYAKRQMIFLKSFEQQLSAALSQKSDAFGSDTNVVETVDLTLQSVDLYIKQLARKLLLITELKT